MLMWNDLIEMLGCSKTSNEFAKLPSKIKVQPLFDEGVLGDRHYYSFFSSGILLLLEDDLINQIVLYMQAEEGFSLYTGELPVPANSLESYIIQLLGVPSATGGGKMDVLMGYLHRWIKYQMETHILHLQFNHNDQLCRVT